MIGRDIWEIFSFSLNTPCGLQGGPDFNLEKSWLKPTT